MDDDGWWDEDVALVALLLVMYISWEMEDESGDDDASVLLSN